MSENGQSLHPRCEYYQFCKAFATHWCEALNEYRCELHFHDGKCCIKLEEPHV